MCYICIIIIVVVLWWYGVKSPLESFQSKDRAKEMLAWFTSNSSPSYNQYLRDFPDSNIVEYESALGLFRGGNASVATIAKVL